MFGVVMRKTGIVERFGERKQNALMLGSSAEGAKLRGMKLWTGTSGFQYPEWKGKFYPEKMPASKMLAYYGERFSSTEVNYTFRQIPAEKTILKWCGETPER